MQFRLLILNFIDKNCSNQKLCYLKNPIFSIILPSLSIILFWMRFRRMMSTLFLFSSSSAVSSSWCFRSLFSSFSSETISRASFVSFSFSLCSSFLLLNSDFNSNICDFTLLIIKFYALINQRETIWEKVRSSAIRLSISIVKFRFLLIDFSLLSSILCTKVYNFFHGWGYWLISIKAMVYLPKLQSHTRNRWYSM